MTTELKPQLIAPRRVYSADMERNAELLRERAAWRAKLTSPQVGDFVRFADGSTERIAHDWGESYQTSKNGSWHIFKSGQADFSGSLNPSLPAVLFKDTGEWALAQFWFFDRDWPRANAAVHCLVPVRVWAVNLLS